MIIHCSYAPCLYPAAPTPAGCNICTIPCASAVLLGSASYIKFNRHGGCVDANGSFWNNYYTGRPFTMVTKSKLGAGYVSDCKRLCTAIGPRCVGFQVHHLHELCSALGSDLTEGDLPGGTTVNSWFRSNLGTGNIAQASGQGGHEGLNCYQKVDSAGWFGAPYILLAYTHTHPGLYPDPNRQPNPQNILTPTRPLAPHLEPNHNSFFMARNINFEPNHNSFFMARNINCHLF